MSNHANPTISVIIPVHRRRKEFFMEAVESVLSQTLEHRFFEVILVRDYQDEDSKILLESWGLRVLTIFDDTLVGKLYHALTESKGEVISLLEDDDRFHPRKLEEVWKAFLFNPHLNYYHNAVQEIDGKGEYLNYKPASPSTTLIRSETFSLKDYRTLLKCSANFNPSSISIRASMLNDRTLVRREASTAFDLFLFFRALSMPGIVLHDNKRLTEYRVHGSTSKIQASDMKSMMKRGFEIYSGHVQALETLRSGIGSKAMPAYECSLSYNRGWKVFYSDDGRKIKFEMLRAVIYSTSKVRNFTHLQLMFWLSLSVISIRFRELFFRFVRDR